ncbi:hypothetical protein FSP39_014194 [Pinctada imbricata]|uniref:B box-type domain-containing protein n=1 Tax=Pinctada imbricata TaxID=66713 RepID=A0AA88XNI6_PINIB|nr:hypothetical protein FSP39_014194 [Pinctada imbricata]
MAEAHQWTVPCSICKDPATHNCNSCGDILCDSCKDIHLKSNASRSHHVVPYAEKADFPVTYCKQHNNARNQYWCQGCQDFACATCVTSTHKGHSLRSLADAFKEKKEEVERELKRIDKEILSVWDASVQQKQENIESFVAGMDKADKEVVAHAEKMHEQIEKIVSSKRKQIADAKTAVLKVAKTEQEQDQKELNDLLKMLEIHADLKSGGKAELMHFTIQNLRSKIKMPTKPRDMMRELISFNPGKISFGSMEYMLGHLSSKSDTPQKPSTRPKEKPKVVPTSASGSKQEVKKYLLSSPETVSSFKAGYNYPSLACAPTGFAWVRTGDSRLQKMDRNGRVLDTINTGCKIGDFTFFDQKNILFTDWMKNGVKMQLCSKNTNAQGFPSIDLFSTTGQPFGICRKGDGCIVISSFKPANVIKYSGSGQVLHRYESQKFKHPLKMAENKITGHLYVCDKEDTDNTSNGRVQVYDVDDKYSYTYFGNEPLNFSPMDVCTDRFGLALIADFKTNKVHVVSMEGFCLQYIKVEASLLNWFSMSNYEGLNNPRYIDVDDEGHVWIGENNGTVKILKYLSIPLDWKSC